MGLQGISLTELCDSVLLACRMKLTQPHQRALSILETGDGDCGKRSFTSTQEMSVSREEFPVYRKLIVVFSCSRQATELADFLVQRVTSTMTNWTDVIAAVEASMVPLGIVMASFINIILSQKEGIRDAEGPGDTVAGVVGIGSIPFASFLVQNLTDAILRTVHIQIARPCVVAITGKDVRHIHRGPEASMLNPNINDAFDSTLERSPNVFGTRMPEERVWRWGRRQGLERLY